MKSLICDNDFAYMWLWWPKRHQLYEIKKLFPIRMLHRNTCPKTVPSADIQLRIYCCGKTDSFNVTRFHVCIYNAVVVFIVYRLNEFILKLLINVHMQKLAGTSWMNLLQRGHNNVTSLELRSLTWPDSSDVCDMIDEMECTEMIVSDDVRWYDLSFGRMFWWT